MTPYLADPDVTLYHGDVLDVLRELPAESVNCIATSPPFYALRDYQVEGQIGLEETPDAWVAALVVVFREARRALRKDGTLWVECGDGYVAKALLGTPWLLAFALRADGWWLRGCNIWAKPNAMPESAKDRCTTAHSYVFQLSKVARYFFDGDAIREPQSEDSLARYGRLLRKPETNRNGGASYLSTKRGTEAADVQPHPDGAHPRSVWIIPTQGYPEAHFATWPEALARRIILAGCPDDGTVLDPFVGSGTTCLVARKLGRRSIGIDLNPDYLALAAKRLQQLSLLAEVSA